MCGREINQPQWLITPKHINDNHWGLLCLNMVSYQAFFDDGLRINPALNICDIIQALVEVIHLSMSKQYIFSTTATVMEHLPSNLTV